MPATAADIPQELFESILPYIREKDEWGGYRGDKHTASVCGQVCRRWTHVCRFMLFHTIHIRSEIDLQDFRLMLQARPPERLPDIEKYLKVLDIAFECCSTEKPWAHHLLLRPRMDREGRYLTTISVKCSHQPSESCRGARSLLPRTLPSNRKFVRGVELKDIRFRSVAEFRRLMSYFKICNNLELRNISWDTEHPLGAFWSMHKVLSSRCEVIISTGHESSLLAPLLLPPALKHSKYDVLLDDYSILLEALQTVKTDTGISECFLTPGMHRFCIQSNLLN